MSSACASYVRNARYRAHYGLGVVGMDRVSIEKDLLIIRWLRCRLLMSGHLTIGFGLVLSSIFDFLITPKFMLMRVAVRHASNISDYYYIGIMALKTHIPVKAFV